MQNNARRGITDTAKAEMTTLVGRYASGQGVHPTAVPSLFVFRADTPAKLDYTFYEPSICLVAQGSKSASMGREQYQYDPDHFLLVSLSTPVTSQILDATPERPHLGLHINLDTAILTDWITTTPSPHTSQESDFSALGVSRLDTMLHDAVLRLLRLLETPRHIPALSPMILREIGYLLLNGPEGGRLRKMVQNNGPVQRIAQAIELIRQHFDEPLSVQELAGHCSMSVSVFHRHFKAITSMSPLQYRKYIQLQEAKRLMLSQNLDAATAGFRVGYESPSQFNREYRRLFGITPKRDTQYKSR